MTRALAGAGADVTVITLPGQGPAPAHVTLRPVRVLEHNFLRRSLAFRDAVARQLVALRPDVVHFRGPFEGEAAVAWASKQAGVKSVYEVNGLPSVELRYHYPGVRDAHSLEAKLRALEGRVASAADLRLTQSQATARFVRLRTQAGATVIPNGARPLPLPDAEHDGERPLRLLYIGALQPWQGLKDLLIATRRADRHTPLSLHVVGPARRSWQRQLHRMAARLKVRDLVVEDAVDKAALQERLAAADVCVAPLTRDLRNRGQGCSPIKLFEYMAAGRCVLASDLPCVREIVDHGRTGWLARPSHPHRLAEAIVHLAGAPELRLALGRRARETIAAEATWEHRHQQLVIAYQALLDGASLSPGVSAPPPA
jgi:glycosyltransferase involved in cell wall biosynthesis